MQDLQALFADLALTESDTDGIGRARIRQVCGADWGWWRTVDDNLALERCLAGPAGNGGTEARPGPRTGVERANDLRRELATCPKSVGWRIRAKVGTRVRWYEFPEEVR